MYVVFYDDAAATPPPIAPSAASAAAAADAKQLADSALPLPRRHACVIGRLFCYKSFSKASDRRTEPALELISHSL